jgi:phosphate-selective porin
MSRNMQGEDVKVNQSSESNLLQYNYLSVKVKDVETMIKNNVEALYIFNNYSLQAEYTQFRLDAYNKRDYIQTYNFDAYYLEGSYFLIGSGKKYKFKESVLGKVKPSLDGALEFAVRYSYINLTDTSNDKDEIGGSQTDYTMGVNWYLSKELKLTLNYIISEPTGTEEYDGRLQILQGRVLFAF